MKILELIYEPEGRRLEFKEKLPAVSDLAKTIVAFANDAGGELFIGIRNEPREITGIAEEDLMPTEERISSLIHDQCYPVIIPDISFHGEDGRRFIKVQVYRGNNLPYYLKHKGKLEGTYIRVGSTNRQADAEIIAELERHRRNISFDSEPVPGKSLDDLNIESFKTFYKERTGETLDENILRKLELIKNYQGAIFPSNSGILFSDGEIKRKLFPYAKIECARFKGISADEFIDQKTIDANISVQAELAYDFVLRHINKGARVKGVYTDSRWEYPVVAIREVIRNAVAHRDYSLTGKDIKVAVYDDMVEITSPGKLLPSIDFNEMEARQSDIRNKVIAPVFKKLGIIDQWGNGLKLIADELKDYPEIKFLWMEKGIQFQVQFVKTQYFPDQPASDFKTEWLKSIGIKMGLSWDQVGTKSGSSWDQVEKLLEYCECQRNIQQMMIQAGWRHRTKFRNKFVRPLLAEKILGLSIPDKPRSSKQEYYLTDRGKQFLTQLLMSKKNHNRRTIPNNL